MENLFAIKTQDEATFKSLVKTAVLEAMKEVSPIKPADKYYTRAALAKELHVSLVSIDKAADEGRLKPYRLGGRVLFKASEVKLEEGVPRGRKQI